MRTILSIWAVLTLLCGAGHALDGAYSQSYAIFIKGSAAGSETVTEKISENGDLVSDSEHDMLVTDGLETKRMSFATRMVFAGKLRTPVSYEYRYTSGGTGDAYSVSIRDAQARRVLTRGGRTSEISVPFTPDMVILDFNVYHQYDYVIRRYDMKRGGRQIFANFVPLIGNDIQLAITYQGEADLNSKSVRVRNYQVEFVGIVTSTASMDKDGRLVRLAIPIQGIEVVRKDLIAQ